MKEIHERVLKVLYYFYVIDIGEYRKLSFYPYFSYNHMRTQEASHFFTLIIVIYTVFLYMTGYGHTEFLKSLVITYNPQEHAKTPILSYTPEYRILPKLNIPLSCSHFY